jgi:hypothetical protein
MRSLIHDEALEDGTLTKRKETIMKILTMFLLFLFFSSPVIAECKKHLELFSAKDTAIELGKSETWVIRNYKINLWGKPSPDKFPKVGELLPGSRALILEETAKDYKIISPFDKSVGWISKIQVKKTLMQDTETRKSCK